jgi:urease accessory protein
MFKRRISGFSIAAAMSFVPSLALAHTGHGAAPGFLHGFEHPVGGLDHVLAMVLVGMLAFQLGGRALCALPVSFVVLMGVGGALGVAGMGIPFVETGIALSVVVLGLAVACRARTSVFAAMAVVSLFAVFHGHAHGAEMPADISGFSYGAGFILATALLHTAGLGFGFTLARRDIGAAALRIAGVSASALELAVLARIL